MIAARLDALTDPVADPARDQLATSDLAPARSFPRLSIPDTERSVTR